MRVDEGNKINPLWELMKEKRGSLWELMKEIKVIPYGS
jgi:hypothetical protein